MAPVSWADLAGFSQVKQVWLQWWIPNTHSNACVDTEVDSKGPWLCESLHFCAAGALFIFAVLNSKLKSGPTKGSAFLLTIFDPLCVHLSRTCSLVFPLSGSVPQHLSAIQFEKEPDACLCACVTRTSWQVQGFNAVNCSSKHQELGCLQVFEESSQNR